MKKTIPVAFILLTLFSAGSARAQHSLVRKWATDTLLKTPESVLPGGPDGILFVSNIDGGAADKDGKGSVGKIAADGKIIKTDWVTGLNAPKGMGLYKNKLYVADLTEVVVIDVEKAEIIQHIPVEGAVFLNDITIDKKGAVYVSDTRNFKIYKIEKGLVSVVLTDLKGPNGLLAVNDDLLILDRGSLLKLLSNGAVSTLTDGMDPSTDGIEMVKPNEYIASAWAGVIYYIYANGEKQVLLDSREQKINTADIGYDRKTRTVYVPTFFKNNVVAYELK